MKNFLRVAALAICAILMTANASAQDNYNATTMGEKVYLETANWGQNSPFNKQIFTSYGGSTNAKAGCVPTAYAIVMRYHEFPTEGTSKTMYNCQASTYVEITDRVYDFSKMPLTNGSGWTEEQQTEVAKFFSHVLHACFPSSIGTSATTVNEGQTSKVLNDYFNYQLINASYQANFTMEQWAEKLRESISNGCPVPYAANNSGTGDSRHMFVVDGYTTGGYFHFNFGWSGSGNGWFKLDNITPSQGDNYSWNGNSQHYALFNLAPNKTPRTVTATANPSSMGTVSINGGTAGSSVSAEVIEGTKATLTAHPADSYALANWTKNGVIIGTKNPIQVTVGESGNDYVANFDEASNVQIEKTCTFKISDVTTSGISGSYCSTWTTGDGIVLSCTKDSEPAYALSTSVNTFFAKAAVGNSETLVSGITYTLTAPEGYVIKSYSFKGKSPSSSYTIDVTVGENTTNVTNASAGVVISASDINAQSTSFMLGSTYAGRAGLAILENGITVTIQSEGGSTPTPTTYTITATANPGTGGTATVNGNSSATVGEGSSVTLAATAANGYIFTGWYKGAEKVSGNANYTFTPTESASYEARFVAKAVSNCNIPTDNTLRYYRFAIAIAKNSYTTDFGSNYENVKKFWQECEDFMNEVYVPLGMCFDVVIDQRLLLGTNLPDNNGLPEISGVTDLINNAIGSGSYDVGLCISYRDDSEENTGLSAVNGAYTSTTKANGYAQADKWVVAHEAGHLFGADHTTEGESSLMDNIGEFFSYPSIKKIRDASVNSGPGNAYKSEVVANNAPTFTAQMKNTYRIPKGACLSIPVYASDADGHSLRYAAIGCSSSTVGNITGGGTMPHFASLKPQTSNIIDYSPKFVADGDSYYLPVDGTNIPSMSAGSYSIAILVNDMPEGNSYDYLNSNPFYSNYDVWDATVEIVDGTPFTASISPAQNSYTAGSDVTVTWGVNNSVFTEDSRVRITMSTDYGKTFSHVLADDVRALNGSKAVTLPNVNVGNVDVDFSNKYVNAVRSMRAGIIRVEVIDGAAYTLTTLSPENGGGFNITGGGAEPDPTPVTYSVAVTAGNGGTATASAATIEQGKDVTLTATPDTGYEFTGWYNGTTMVSDANPYTFAVTGNINYVANFEAVEQGGDETTDPLAGKWFRLKENNNGRYMNVKNHTAHAQKVTAGGVNVAARVEDSNAQIFFFEKSGDGYMLKDGDDYYINCLEWSVDASSTTGGSTLLFEETGTEGIYYIKWYNTYKGGERYFKVGPDSNGSGDHPYCDADNKTVTWTLEETVRTEVTPLPFKVEIEGWWENNPNTHLGTITVGGTAMKLTPAHRTASGIRAAEGAVLAFTRKYRGYEFNGFHIGTTSLGENPTLTAENIAAINATTPLVAKFTATDDVTLFYDDDQYSYRIPAIARTGNNTLVAVSDYRHNLDDIGRDNHGTGTKRIDLVMRTSNDNGATWSATRTIAAGDNSKTGSYLRAFGDAAIAAYGNNILVMAAAGDVLYTAGTTSNPNRMARIYSTDNGENWTIEEMTTKMYSQSTSLIPSAGSAFFGSGKLAVDENFNNTGKARIYGALLVRIGSNNYNNFAVFSDDLGATWKILGGDNTNPIASGDEPKIEILPNGQILLSARRGGGRVFRVFTYGDDKANGAGSWGNAAVNGCGNGGSNATNGEIICLNAKKIDGTAVKLLLQSQPQGGSNQYDRNNVTIWYKEVSAAETYTSATIASDWTQGKQVSTVKSAYSAMCLQENGKIAFFFEEAPCYGDDHTKGYSMVYVPLTVEEITGYSYYSVDTELPETATIKAVLTDANGNEYHETVETSFSTEAVAAALTAKYPYITLGTNGTLASNNNGTYTYTNTVELPFAVSNNSTTVWHNIYWPANTNENGYPIYLSASEATDTYVPKVTESKVYGNSSYNTLNTNDNISWAIYNVGNGFAFTFKNKVTGKYIQATGVANGNAQNVVYADETDATAFTLLKETNSYRGEYSLVAGINGTTGYLCSTSATGYHYATLYSGKSHQGAWVKFEKVDYEGIIAQINGALATVGANIGQYTLAGEKVADYNNIKSSMTNSGEVKLNTLKEYLTDIETLFTGATLNSPTTGRYYHIAYDYGTTAGKLYMQGVATEQYKNNQNSYAAKFDKGTGAESIWYYDGGLLSYTAGKYIKENGNDRGLQAVGTKQNATFSTSSRDAGKFCINLGSYLHANVTGSNYYSDHCSGNNCSQHDFIIEDVPSLPIEITGAGYATLYAPVALEIPAGVTAYTVAIDEEWAILSEIEGGIIPAGTGVVIYSETADTYNFTITTTEDSATSALSGTVSAAYIEEDAYVLTLDSELGVCFGMALKNQQNNTAWLNNSHKAYLPKQMGSNAASYSFRFDNGSTVIEEVKAESGKVKAIYDLQGRIVENPSKGIYIINGKKVFVK